MTLFSVECRDHGSLVVEAATVVAADGWWTFRNVDGHSLATLPTSDVLSIEAAAHRAWAAHGRVLPLRPRGGARPWGGAWYTPDVSRSERPVLTGAFAAGSAPCAGALTRPRSTSTRNAGGPGAAPTGPRARGRRRAAGSRSPFGYGFGCMYTLPGAEGAHLRCRAVSFRRRRRKHGHSRRHQDGRTSLTSITFRRSSHIPTRTPTMNSKTAARTSTMRRSIARGAVPPGPRASAAGRTFEPPMCA